LIDYLFLNGHTRAGANDNVKNNQASNYLFMTRETGKIFARMIFMAVQRAPEREDGRRLKYRCRSSVGTLIGIGTLRHTRGLDAKPLMDVDVAKERG
jgi:hypothetical protein